MRSASRVLRRRSVQRLLAVGGLAVAGWLLSGGGTASADQVRPDEGPRLRAGAPVHPAPVADRFAGDAASKPSAELDVLAGRARRTGSHTTRPAQALTGPDTRAGRAADSAADAAASLRRAGRAPEGTHPSERRSGRDSAVPNRAVPNAANPDAGVPEWSRLLPIGPSPAGAAPVGVPSLDGAPESVVPDLPGGPAQCLPGRCGPSVPASPPYEPGIPSLRPVAPGAATAAGEWASAPLSGAAEAVEPDAAGHPGQPAGPQPASSGSSGAVRTGVAGEAVPLGTARATASPYAVHPVTRTAPASRDAAPAVSAAVGEPSFSPD